MEKISYKNSKVLTNENFPVLGSNEAGIQISGWTGRIPDGKVDHEEEVAVEAGGEDLSVHGHIFTGLRLGPYRTWKPLCKLVPIFFSVVLCLIFNLQYKYKKKPLALVARNK